MGLIKKNFREHFEGRDVPPYEYALVNKAGEEIEAINSSKLIQYEGGNAILGVVTDITERKKVEESLRKSFDSASNIYVDTDSKECEVTISIDDYQGEIKGKLFENGVSLEMIDYCDVYPFKYVFGYKLK